jgi:hypothetical protein
MNKYAQRLALWLIDRRIRKIEKNQTSVPGHLQGELAGLKRQRANIASINNPWQGTFSVWNWDYYAKNEKYIKPFPGPEPKGWFDKNKSDSEPLPPEDQAWADLSDDEWHQAVHELDGYYDNQYKVIPAGEPRDYWKE